VILSGIALWLTTAHFAQTRRTTAWCAGSGGDTEYVMDWRC
jgi:hypothetical protein